MQMKMCQSMFLNYTTVHHIKGQRSWLLKYRLLAALAFELRNNVFFFYLRLSVCRCKRGKIHCIQWLNLWFMGFMLYALLSVLNKRPKETKPEYGRPCYINGNISQPNKALGVLVDSVLHLIFWFGISHSHLWREKWTECLTNLGQPMHFLLFLHLSLCFVTLG